jgi:FtsH-binding integral membrane protein
MRIVSCLVVIFATIPLAFKPIRRSVPLNYFLLLIITIAQSCSVASFTSLFTTESILLSIGVLCATVVSIFFAALVTPVNVKLLLFLCVGLLVSVVLQLVLLISLMVIGYLSEWWLVAYAFFGILITGIYILVDLLLVMVKGGFDLDDYILGALYLYFDIIRMFLYIVMIFGKKK